MARRAFFSFQPRSPNTLNLSICDGKRGLKRGKMTALTDSWWSVFYLFFGDSRGGLRCASVYLNTVYMKFRHSPYRRDRPVYHGRAVEPVLRLSVHERQTRRPWSKLQMCAECRLVLMSRRLAHSTSCNASTAAIRFVCGASSSQ